MQRKVRFKYLYQFVILIIGRKLLVKEKKMRHMKKNEISLLNAKAEIAIYKSVVGGKRNVKILLIW